MGPGAGIEDDPVGVAVEPVQALDELALVVGLKEADDQPQLRRPGADPPLQLGEIEASVMLGVAAAQLVQVDPVHHLDSDPAHPRHWISSLIAARSSAGGTVWPINGSPGLGHRTNGTGPSPTRFLSRAVAKITASTSTSSSVVGSP